MRPIAAIVFISSALALPLANGDIARGLERDSRAILTAPISQTNTANWYGETSIEIAQASFTSGTIAVSKNLARQAAERENGGLNNYRAEPTMHGPVLDAPYRDGGDTWIFTFRGGPPGAPNFTVESEVAVNKTSLEVAILYNGPLRTASSRNNGPQNNRPRNNRPRNGNGNGQQGRNSDNPTQQDRPVQQEPVPEPATPDPRQTTEPEAQPPAGQPSEDPVATSTVPSPAEAPSEVAANNQSSPDRASSRPAPSRALSAPGDITTAKNFARQAAERVNGGLTNYSSESSMHGPALESPFRDDGDRWVFTFRGGFPGDISLPIESEVAVSKSTFETTVLYNGPVRDGSLQ